MSEPLRAGIVLVAALFLALTGAAGHYIFAGLPGSGAYIPADQSVAFAAGLMMILVLLGGVIGLLYFASREFQD